MIGLECLLVGFIVVGFKRSKIFTIAWLEENFGRFHFEEMPNPIDIQQKFNSFNAVSEEHNIVVLHHVVLSILLHFSLSSYLLFGLVLNPIFNFAHIDTNELTFELRVNFSGGLRRGGPFFYKPG